MISILAVGLFNSIMFPTIFSLSLEGLDDLKPQASGILCTMIVGGAIIPPMYGYLTDLYGFKWAFSLLIICYLYIYFFGKVKFRKPGQRHLRRKRTVKQTRAGRQDQVLAVGMARRVIRAISP